MTRSIRNAALFLIPLFIAFAMFASPASGQRATRAKQAAAEFKELRDLSARLEKIPFNADDREPHKSFLKKNEGRIVYNDPSGQWIVRSEEFWKLSEKYRDLPIGDDIAWAAAQNPVPGECEGYMNCGIYYGQITAVQYLRSYPRGKYSTAALGELKAMFTDYANESNAGTSYTPPEDAADRAELKKMLKEIDTVLLKVPSAGAETVRGLIKRIGDRYK